MCVCVCVCLPPPSMAVEFKQARQIVDVRGVMIRGGKYDGMKAVLFFLHRTTRQYKKDPI